MSEINTSGVGFSNVEKTKSYLKPKNPYVSGLKLASKPKLITKENKTLGEQVDALALYFVDPVSKDVGDVIIELPRPDMTESTVKAIEQRLLQVFTTIAGAENVENINAETWKQVVEEALKLLNSEKLMESTFNVKFTYGQKGSYLNLPRYGYAISCSLFPVTIAPWDPNWDRDEIAEESGGAKPTLASTPPANEL